MWLAPDNGRGTELLTYQATVPTGDLISRSAAVVARRFVVLTGIEHAIVGSRKMRQPTTIVQQRWRRNRLRPVVRGAGPCLVHRPKLQLHEPSFVLVTEATNGGWRRQ
jgi:hypothetical protein